MAGATSGTKQALKYATLLALFGSTAATQATARWHYAAQGGAGVHKATTPGEGKQAEGTWGGVWLPTCTVDWRSWPGLGARTNTMLSTSS